MVRFQSCSVNLFYFFLRRDGESAFRWGAELGMSRALPSEACERDESWRCLPSGLKTGETREKGVLESISYEGPFC